MTTTEEVLADIPARPAPDAAVTFAGVFNQAADSAQAMAVVADEDDYAANALRSIADAATAEVPSIRDRATFQSFAASLGVRKDWHEPDEQALSAVPTPGPWGFDNAMTDATEHSVVFYKDDKPVARVNLATLCAWACQEN